MRGEVEDDVDVVLVQAQVEAGTVDVVHLAQFLVLHQLAELPDGGVVFERVPDHEDHARRGRRAVQPAGALGGRRERLFHQDVLSGLDRLQRHGHVGAGRGRDDDRVDLIEGRPECGMPGG